jgi:GTP-binding protein HflX
VLLSDTVGFVRKLPHALVEAFKATLEELCYADVLLHVIDLSSPDWEEQAAVVDALIEDLGAGRTPCLRVFNKCDVYFGELPHSRASVCISARTGEGVDELLGRLTEYLGRDRRRFQLFLPYGRVPAGSAAPGGSRPLHPLPPKTGSRWKRS